MNIIITFCGTLTISCFAVAQDMNKGQMISQNVYYEIPYRDYKAGIHEKVELHGTKFKFIFDSGAPLCISKGLQNKYRFPIIEQAELSDSNNKKSITDIVQVDTISFGGITFTNIPAVVIDFGNSPIEDESIQGLMGSNIFRFLTVSFDLKHQKIVFTDDNRKLSYYLGEGGQPLFLDKQSDAYMVIKINHAFVDSAHFDSGMDGLFHMNLLRAKKYIKEFGRKVILERKTKKAHRGVLGDGKPREQIQLKSKIIELNRIEIINQVFVSTPAKSRLGRELLKYGTLILDYKNATYYFFQYD